VLVVGGLLVRLGGFGVGLPELAAWVVVAVTAFVVASRSRDHR